MKNLFYIHSHITFFVAKGIISKLNLEEQSIIFIISRNYKNEEIKNCRFINVSDIHDELDSYNLKNFYYKNKYIDQVDKLIIQELSGDYFRVFLPHIFHPVMQIIGTHPYCKEIHIMEEGVNAYASYLMHFKQKSFIKGTFKNILNAIPFIGCRRIFFVKNFDLRRFKKDVEPVFYTVTSKGFEGIPYKVERVAMIPDDNLVYNISNSSVLVLEGAVEQGNLMLESLLKGLEDVLKDILDIVLYVKFHPAQSQENRSAICKLIEKYKIEPKIIPDEIAFEQIILTNDYLKVYGFTTSLLFYAHEYGSEVKSYEESLKSDSLFKEFRSKNNFDLKSLLNGN